MLVTGRDAVRPAGEVSRRRLIQGLAAGLPILALADPDEAEAAIERVPLGLVSRHYAAIQQIYSLYGQSLDGLCGPQSNLVWAATFTGDGVFRLVDGEGGTLLSVTGTKALAELWLQFPDIETTRHWINNLLIRSITSRRATASCYINALDVGASPSPVIRTGIYQDVMVRVRGAWRFESRTLLLDPASSPPSDTLE